MNQQPIPSKVQLAMAFAQMMRATACSHLTADDAPGTTKICKTSADAGTYTAAMEVMRTYFNGENQFAPEDVDRPNDPPAPGIETIVNPPSPPGATNNGSPAEPAQTIG